MIVLKQLIIAIALCVMFIPTNAILETVEEPYSDPVSEWVEAIDPDVVADEFFIVENTIPVVLQAISWCESQYRQYDKDENVLRGEINPKDVGLFQFNERWWLDFAVENDYNIYTSYGRTELALYVYKTKGTKDWRYSETCWGEKMLQM